MAFLKRLFGGGDGDGGRRETGTTADEITLVVGGPERGGLPVPRPGGANGGGTR